MFGIVFQRDCIINTKELLLSESDGNLGIQDWVMILWSLADGELFPRIIPKCCNYYFKLITKILSHFYRKVMAT